VFPKIESRDSTGNPVYGVSVEKLGVYLQVGVQIGLDDDITLNIYPQVTSLQGVTNIQGVDYPIINTDEEEATVRAIQGEVIVLGGLKADHHDFNKSGVPLLSRLPILGKLFASDTKTEKSDELMFFLTPEILETGFTPPLEVKIDVTPPPPQPAPAS
jgi:type II secretory pathway component GspD/PulD (secretin)